TEERIRVVLGHELAHVKRRDWIVQLAADLLRAAYWFNPLTWIVCRRLHRESEHACDDAVLGLGIAGTEYAAQLVALAREFRLRGSSWSPVVALARRSTLERRVRAVVSSRVNHAPLTMSSALATLVLLLALAVRAAGLAGSEPAETAVARAESGVD